MKEPASYYLFVYGSLRSGFRSPAYEYISRFFIFISNAKVRGRLYDLGPYPAAVPSTEEAFIVGELYELKDKTEFSWAIGQLDDYEGLIVEPGETPLYRRELATILAGDSKVTAWVYWYNGDVEGKPVVSSGDILEYIASKSK